MRVMLLGSNPLTRYTIAAGAAPVENDLIALNAAGTAVVATDAAAIKVAGVCVGLYLVDGVATEVEVRDGIVALANSAAGAALARTDRGRPAYVADKDTVSKLPGTHGVVAGLLVDVDGDDVYVDLRPHALAAAAALAVQDARIAALVELEIDALTLTAMTGTANTSPAAETNIDALTGTLTGTLDNALADVSGTFDATAIATINKNFKELQAELTTQRALNIVLINNAKTFATQLNNAGTDIAALIAALIAADLMDAE